MGYTYKNYKMLIILGIVLILIILFSFKQTPIKTSSNIPAKIGMPNNAVNQLRDFLKP